MANTIDIGLAVSANNTGALNISTFDSVSVPGQPVPFPLAPQSVAASAGNGGVGLVWNDLAFAATYNVLRSTATGGPYTQIGSTAATAYTDATALNGVNYYYIITGISASGTGMNSVEVSATPTPAFLPKGWIDMDIGILGFSGAASYASGTFTIQGSGSDIWGKADGFNYCFQTVSGDGAIVARVTGVQSTGTYAKAAVMFRDSNLANSMQISLQVSPGGATDLTWRTSAGASCSDTGWTGSGVPKWIRLVRTGTSFTGSYSANGSSWTQLGNPVALPFSNDILVGLAVSAVDNAALNSSTFDNVSISGFGLPLPPAGLTAISGSAQVTLSWMPSADATSYNLKRATTDGGPYGTVANLPGTNYVDSGLANGTTYYYVVSAMISGSESANSSQVSTIPRLPGNAIWIGEDNAAWNVPGNWFGTAPTDNSTANLTFSQATGGNSLDNLQNLMLASLTVSSGAGSNTMTGNQLFLSGSIGVSSTAPQFINTALAVSGNQTIHVTSGGRLTLGGVIQDGASGGAFTKAGGGTLVIGGWNTLSGVSAYNLTFASGGGIVVVTDPSALGSPVAGSHSILFTGGATLDLQTDTSFAGFTLTMHSTGTASTIILNRETAGPGIVHSFPTLIVGSTLWNFITGTNATSGTAGISFTSLQLTAGNNDRPLTLGGDAQISFGSASITSTGIPKRLQLDGSNQANFVSGVISDGISGAVISLIKANASTWTLYGSNSYSGSTTVTGGALVLKQPCLSDTAQLAIAGSGTLQLDHGTADLVGSLVLGGTTMPNGVYDISNSSGRITGSGQIQVGPLAAPSGTAAAAGNGQATLNWTPTNGATSYNIQRATTNGGPYTPIASSTTASYTDTGLTNGTVYYYVISAVNSNGEGANSAQISVTPQVPAPAAPAGLIVTASNGQVFLSWTASSGAAGYKVKRSLTGSGTFSTLATTVSGVTYADPVIVGAPLFLQDTLYYYAVSAYNAGGESSNATPVAVLPAPPTPQPARVQGGSLLLSIPTLSGLTYQLQRRSALTSGSWADEGVPVLGTGGVLQLTHTNATALPVHFYQIKIVAP